MKRLIWLALFLASGNLAAEENQPRIIGGIDSGNNEIPWQALINISFPSAAPASEPDFTSISSFMCGGVVVSQRWILTAAHCLVKNGSTASLADVRVWVGITSRKQRPSGLSVSALILHEDYNPVTFLNDIALLQLAAPLHFTSNIQPILPASPSEQLSADTEFALGWVDDAARPANLLISGWGQTNGGTLADTLQQTLLSGVPDTTCAQIWNGSVAARSTSTYVCAASPAPNLLRDSCSGDSGGPLVWKNANRSSDDDFGLRLLGLVSFGSDSGCASSTPGVYTQVSNYIGWLQGKGVSLTSLPIFSVDPFRSDFNQADIQVSSLISDRSEGGSIGLLSLLLLGWLFVWRYFLLRVN